LEEKIKIKVTVSGRIYPLKVTPSEEEHVRKAVAFIEERTRIIETKYAIKDIQDIQALILIELASELHYLKNNLKKNEQLINDKIDRLLQL
jgi:cell division protein ZapA